MTRTLLFLSMISMLFMGTYAQRDYINEDLPKPSTHWEIIDKESLSAPVNVNTEFELPTMESFMYASSYFTSSSSSEEIIYVIPLFPMIITFFVGVVFTLCCTACLKKRESKKAAKQAPLSYEQVYPVQKFAEFV